MSAEVEEGKYGAWPKTEDELTAYIRATLTGPHDYNTSADAMTKIALAAFNYASHVVGATGFQASCAQLSFIGRSRGIEGPFAIINGEDLLYPQYDIRAKVDGYLREWPKHLAPKAKTLLETSAECAHPAVVQRWREIAALGGDAG